MTYAFALTVAALGFVGAFLSGLVGVGGAVVMIPLLYYVPPILGVGTLDAKQVAGVTMAQVLVAALLGAWTHGRRNLVHRSLAFRGGTAMAAGSLLGSLGSHFAGGRVLLAVFAVMATLALPLMFLSPADLGELAEPSRVTVSPAQAVAYPAIVGFLAGFVGAGGAFVLLPVLIGLMRVPVRVSIATSLVMTAASAAAGFVGKAATGQIPLAPAAMVVVGSLAGAPLGASVSRLVPVELLRGVLAVLVGLAALRVWADVLTP